MADDPWAEFSPQQTSVPDPWSAFSPEAPPVSASADLAKSGGIGIVKGGIGLAGLPADIGELGARGIDKATKFVGGLMGLDLQRPGTQQTLSGQITGEQPARKTLTGFTLPGSAAIREKVEGVTGPLYEPKTTAGGYAQTVGEFLPGMIGGPLNAGRTVATRLAKTFTTNVAAPAVVSHAAGDIPGISGSDAEPYVKAAAAIATPAALSAARSAFTPVVTPGNRQAARDYLHNEGVTDLMAGQVTGSERQQYREATSGWRYEATKQRQLEQLTEASLRRIGETGTDAFAGVQQARPRIGAAIEDAAQRMIVRQDPALADRLVGQNFEGELLRSGLSGDQERRILALRDNVLNQFETVGRRGGGTPWTEMSGTAFHNLIKTGSPLDRAIKGGDSEISHWASQMKTAVLDAAERTANRQGTREGVGNRQALTDLQTARRQYGNLVALEEAISKSGALAANGVLTPAAVFRAAANRNRTDYAKGRGDFAQLAQASNLLMTTLPQSGTAPRLMAQMPAKMIGGAIGGAGAIGGSLLGGAAAFNPLTAAAGIPMLIGGWAGPKIQNSFVMSRPGQYLAGNRPANRQPYPAMTMADQLRRLMVLSPRAIGF